MSDAADTKLLTALDLAREFDRSFAAAPSAEAQRTHDFLVVRIGAHACALRLQHVRGLVAAPRITRVPSPAPDLLGVAGARGAIVPVFSLASLLGHAATFTPGWIVLAGDRELIGLAFERYEQLLRARIDDVAVVHDAEHGRSCMREIVRAGEHAYTVVDVPALVDDIVTRNRNVGPRPGRPETE